ncbi:ROK family protein [Ruania alba]|uniref:Sugar kinase of the NBD/HSP70 family, may contain an N-terminal HTH domain n=1 Tax=Ruania alba TaxID=648782 RepID=A0A1H5NGJ4_9MICO|nr:ROK family protein [Ruania alba]SEE99957.1 Sugar kinase of the NBD/HSP70 family, may contain an N-terminal HTH domain [Ruania alba]
MATTSVLGPADLGRANRARVIRALQVHGPMSRSEVARELGIGRGSVTTIVQPLLDQGLLLELAKVPAAHGKPPRPLWFADTWQLGAVFAAPDVLVVATVSLDGQVLQRSRARFTDVDSFRTTLLTHSERLFRADTLLGIGVGSAGAVDVPTGTIMENYRIPTLNHLPLGPLLADHFGVPVYVDHHPRVQAIGDLWFGVGRDCRDFASVYTGDVLGVGLVADGRAVHGPRGGGGEIGHTVVDQHGTRCMCGQLGCWYTVASLGWLRDRARELGIARPDELTSRILAADPSDAARTLRGEYARNLALGLANLEQLLGSGTYVLHGDAAGGGDAFAALVAEEITRRIPRRGAEIRVIAAPEQDDATILGAAGLVMFRTYDAQL